MHKRTMIVMFSATLLLAAAGCQKAQVRGSGGREMTLTTPRSITITRGETKAVEVGVDRKMFADPVTVRLSRLPNGVNAERLSQTIETDAATFLISAARDATLVVNQPVEVTAEGPDNMVVTDHIPLTVQRQ